MRPYHFHFIFLFCLTILLVTACASDTAAVAEPGPLASRITLKISGSGSTSPILGAVQAAFEADTPGYHLEVLPGSGSGGGVKGIIEGVLDVAAMARPPKAEEAAQGVEYVELGQAAQAIITHSEVGITNLTGDQVFAIFTGEITQWSEVGGPDLPLILYVRDESDSSTKALRSHIIDETPFAETVAQVFTSQSDMLAAVAGTPGSVGIATWPTTVAIGANVQPIVIDGIAPNDPTYPMTNSLGISYLVDRQADVQPLIDWLGSERGRAALQEVDMIIQ